MVAVDAAGLGGWRLLEDLLFDVRHVAGDDRAENPGELVRGGSDPFGLAQSSFHPTTTLAKLVLAVA